MEILDSNDAIFVVDEDLLNFQFDDETTLNNNVTGSSSSLETTFNANKTTSFSHEPGFFPVVEEELEWLSNKDAFPSVETCFGEMIETPGFNLHHESPISVLENSTSFNSNGIVNGSSVTSCCESLKVPANHPVRARSKGCRSRRKACEFTVHPYPVIAKSKKPSAAGLGRKCMHCQTDTTPQWRAGPMGPKTLCNACGVRYKSGRLLPEYRPANSPTFASGVHSNSHRKVVEMRKKKQVPMIGEGVFAFDGSGYIIG